MSTAARATNPDRSNRLILTGAVALAILAAILVFVSLSSFGSDDGGGNASTFGATQNVVVASQDIKAGTKIDSDMLEVSTLPVNAIIDGAITDKSGLEGLTARYPLAKGDQLSATKLGQLKDDTTFADVVPDGKRAVSVNVEEKTSVGGLIVAGDHVDVIVIGTTKTAGEGATSTDEFPVSFVLLEDVEVLSVAQESQKPVARLDKDGNPIVTDSSSDLSSRPDDTDAAPKAKTVTLGVAPEDAARLALAGQSYAVYLALRPPGDDSRVADPEDLQQIEGVR